ncbi:hypothetical protein SETIT_2G434200v2 [Setaria italica]|uniref:Uncharacterized protein n=1 Tax=Setaria italica TaxID=4555 RepID=A0A368Q957_SETIT|nr:hypothetical protein SETIT_2G434200v2 [Setaria italica]
MLCLFLIACWAGLLLSITGKGERTKEASNGEAKFRVLRGLNTLGLRQKQRHGHGVSPAPAPARALTCLRFTRTRDCRCPGKLPTSTRGGMPRCRGRARRGTARQAMASAGARRKACSWSSSLRWPRCQGRRWFSSPILVVFLRCRRFQGI